MITSKDKQPIVKEFQRAPKDTGSPEVQIALLSHRIKTLTDHLKGHVKDHHGRRGLLLMVGQRNKLLKYLARTNEKQFTDVLSRLGLRK